MSHGNTKFWKTNAWLSCSSTRSFRLRKASMKRHQRSPFSIWIPLSTSWRHKQFYLCTSTAFWIVEQCRNCQRQWTASIIWPSLYLSTTRSWRLCIGRALMPKDRSSPHFNSVNHILNSHFYLRLGYLNIVALILGGRFFNIMWLPLKWMGSQMMMTIDADQFGEH